MKVKLVSFETAKQLKEVGFDIKTDLQYKEEKGCSPTLLPSSMMAMGGFFNTYSAPTLALTVEWFEVVHGIIIDVYSWKDHAADNNDPVEWKGFIDRKVVYIHFKSRNEAIEGCIWQAIKLIKKK